MFRSFLSACAIAILILPTLVFSARTRRCPVKTPETLLSLYKMSDVIYLARFNRNEEVGVVKDEAGDSNVSTRKHFDVTSALKGDLQKLFVLEEQEFRSKFYKPSDEEPDAEIEEDYGPLYRRPNLQPGETVLLFLKRYPQEDGSVTLGLTDYRDAIKKLTGERLGAYEARIRELNSIFAGKKKVDNEAVVDWLVRTTQDPLTRWEGAFELQQSYEQMQWQDEQKEETEELSGEQETEAVSADEATDETASAEESESGEEENDATTADEEFDLSTYARLLTDAQKETLTNILIAASEVQSSETTAKDKPMSEGDRVLIELVSNWGGTRLAKFLLQQMQTAGQDPYVVFRLMTTIVEILDDEELVSISDKYGEVYYEDGDSFVVEDKAKGEVAEENEAQSDAADADETTAAENETATVAENDAATAASDEAKTTEESGDGSEQAHRVTYGELRVQLMFKFVIRSTAVITKAEDEEQAKAGH